MNEERAEEGQLRPGAVLMGRYTLKETLGEGGMGKVYRANDPRLGRDVAIKILTGDDATQPEMRERFEREMRAVAAFSHPNVMEIYDVGSHGDKQVAVMELIEGTRLRDLMGQALPVERAVEIATGVAAGLAAAHQRHLLHRDIKPENIIVSPDGHPKILDFGLARAQHPEADQLLTQTSATPGTIPYMSPEQAAGEALESSTDVFSLGTVLFEMLTGANPFRGASAIETLRRVANPAPPRVVELRKDVPEELDSLLARMLEVEPRARPTAREVTRQLRASRQESTARPGKLLDAETASSPPTTQYARCGDIHIAYQVFGNGPINLLIVPGFISNVDNCWANSHHARWLRALGSFARVAVFDKRGTGLSDRVSNLPNMEQRVEDVCTVMDAAGFETAALLGISEGGSLASLFAATYPQRCQGLILHGSFARFESWFDSEDALEELLDYIRSSWGSGMSLPGFAPSMANDPEFQEWWGKFERLGANPGSAIALIRMNSQIDVSEVLPAIQAPTLVVHRTEDVLIDPEASRFLAAKIPGARLFSSPGTDHIPWVGDTVDQETEAVQEFLGGLPDQDTREHVLATVLAIRLGRRSGENETADTAASDVTLARVRDQVRLHRGTEMSSYRQVHVSTFDGPVRAIRCARAIAASTTRAGLCVHTGEVALGDKSVRGMAVDVAVDTAEISNDGEVVVTRIVKDLVAGSGLKFAAVADDRLRDSPDSWHLYRVQ